ncbi:hypothetical protein [Rubritalea marina]|uniref:hypothetical protein n=1 Tax=Rubritalea marina TaxID=361055 RepID=UPI00036D60C1|nr:hypothetical protein [Rubritalea marina]
MSIKNILPALAISPAISLSAQTQEPAIPIGKLHIQNEIVYVGDHSTLTWDITHPQTITDVIDIDDGGGTSSEVVVVKKDLLVKVSMIGTGITDSSGKEYSSTSEIRFNGGPWEHIFTGPGAAVDVTEVLIERVAKPGTTIEFRSRYIGYDQWRYQYSDEIEIFLDGDEPPKNPSSDTLATSAEEYMLPYTNDGKLTLGALDMIYAAELTHTDQSSRGYDMQDSIVLVRFTDLETGVGSAKGEVDDHINGGSTELNIDAPESDEDNSQSNREYSKDESIVDHDYSEYDTNYGCGNAGGGKPKDKSRKSRNND